MEFTRDDHPFQRLFTLEEANATLPLVKAIVADLSNLTRDVVERRQRCVALSLGRDVNAKDPYTEELVEVERELKEDTQRLSELVDELRELGVEPKNASIGLVDFPCELDGRIVLLCWQLGEPSVQFWHKIDGGYEGRQPVSGSFIGREKTNSLN
ncbi:MAG: DUF2203 domain-containing protein [Pirellulales bacterium]|nr:DUF2203 domain-containing protein [Pirellulales bacterium]